MTEPNIHIDVRPYNDENRTMQLTLTMDIADDEVIDAMGTNGQEGGGLLHRLLGILERVAEADGPESITYVPHGWPPLTSIEVTPNPFLPAPGGPQ